MIAFKWRLFLYSCLLLAPLVVGIQAYEGVDSLSREIDMASDLTVGGDDSVRLEVEYYRMRDAFERFIAGDPKVDADEVLTRFDIVWSRAHGISTAPGFHRFSAESGIVDLSKALLRVLPGGIDARHAADGGHGKRAVVRRGRHLRIHP